MYIEIKGVQFVNKGAELMLEAIILKIREYWPDAQIVLKGGPLSPYKKRALLGAYQKLTIRKNILDLNICTYYFPLFVRRYLNRWGIITEADIDLVLDASGFAYGDQWGTLQTRHLGSEIKRCQRFGGKYIFLPQAFGPFSRKKDQEALKGSLKYAKLICARDSDSLKNIHQVSGLLPNLKQFPDFTNLLNGVVPKYWVDGKNKVCFVPNSNMVHDKNPNHDWREKYISIMTLLMQQTVSSGYTPILLNHEGDGDRDICNELNLTFNNKLEIIEEPDALKIKGILGNSRAVVCSRFHGCVSALSQGVVCLGTSWSHKYEHLFNDYGVSDLLINPIACDQSLRDLLDNVLTGTGQHQLIVSENAGAIKKKSSEMWLSVKHAANN